MMYMEVKKIIELFRAQTVFNLVSHILPDGDSIGSLLALGEVLDQMGKRTSLFSPGRVPGRYAFLPGSKKIAVEGMTGERSAVAVVLDCSDLERTGAFQEQIGRCGTIVNIDHHVTNCRFGNLNLVDPEASATGEIIFGLIKALPVQLTETVATALYVAVATDTGTFKFDNTTAATHRVAAALLEAGVKPGNLSPRIFDERPLAYYLLLKEALATLELYAGNRIAVLTVSRELLERCGTTIEEIDGLINYTRNIEGVEIGILFYVESESEVKVGFRSRSVDVSKLAGQLNGGGHARAAGCRLHGPYGKVKQTVLGAAEELLHRR